MIDPQRLIQKITLAFGKVPYPGDDNLTDSTYGEESDALIRDFTGKTNWQELSPEFLDQAPESWNSALSFFSGAALQFYLPAYLIADIKGQLFDADPTVRLCISLTPLGGMQKIAKVWGGGTMGDYARRDFEPYNAPQVQAIVDYLWWRLESDETGGDIIIEQALENYWLERLEPTDG
ncbi:MAG: DUF6714 family protein [Leptolyngbyaceae cyanobacterium]